MIKNLKMTVVKGATFRKTVTYKLAGLPVDLQEASIVFRIGIGSNNIITYSTETGDIEIEPPPTLGKCILTIPAEDTATFNWSSDATCDMFVTFPNGEVERLFYGKLKLDKSVA